MTDRERIAERLGIDPALLTHENWAKLVDDTESLIRDAAERAYYAGWASGLESASKALKASAGMSGSDGTGLSLLPAGFPLVVAPKEVDR